MMKLVAVTLIGIEDITISELKGKKPRKIADGRVLFENNQEINLKSINILYRLIKQFAFKNKLDLYSKFKKIDFKIEEPFVVRCFRKGKHNFRSIDIEKKLGEIIFESGYKVDLKNPKTVVYIELLNKKCIIGILLKDKLAKREYRLKRHPASISSILAYSMLRIAGFKKNNVLVDPFCKDGIIPIEAALFGSKYVYGFDENLNNIRNARINVGLARINVNFSKYDVEWLGTKFKKASIDCIVTAPPFPSRSRKEEDITNLYKEFFNQARYVLKKKGCIVVTLPNPTMIERNAKNNFKLKEKRKVMMGKMPYYVLKFV